ncbi:hypothetical protein A2761_02765 [Candidatus Kaiserbacteria bacterium RIFCSPHIGHO2_01_FULL_51_33]|uniref:Glycine-rich domain-containing protein n=1 Tax=Candidatus Kaiserbacteria bacterium RIFCSPLOWO2_01_FULL_51_21 TaxID=1798508 RepID=A0A1F6EDH6_9BACT|nr:MAG: hypothetical protein A2761_02765 [Candidatus Kaiserbacteria bacterium RIFCSPHIGHO2_01_FULL_51_33]OGG71696.1 MAG: hypothetical protein A3A35_00860 [Candidatus Kaiserbacteria bacterium RIFCSPLOWO2_01_FULL_51_21]
MTSLRTSLLTSLKAIILALLLSVGISYLYAAWAPPTGVPPIDNTPAPINVGSMGQTKTSSITATDLIGQNSVASQLLQALGGTDPKVTSPKYCIGTDCITAWPSGGAMNIQTILYPGGTWTKPAAGTLTRIQCWGGGGGGSCASGGGGGGYNEKTVLTSSLSSSVTATIGAGGTGGVCYPGGNGGVTTFGGILSAYGGGGGGGNYYGGGGGGSEGPGYPGGTQDSYGIFGNEGAPTHVIRYDSVDPVVQSETLTSVIRYAAAGGAGGMYSAGMTNGGHGDLIHGGGGGAYAGGNGGSSIGGGGGGAGASTGGHGGLSLYGGKGGDGKTTGTGNPGSVPGGGGGASNNPGGAGAPGQCIITTS